MSEKRNPKWKRFEMLVAKIQQKISPNAKVTLDDKIIGRKTRVKRQIDISVRETIGQFDILVVIDCKDYSKPVDVKAVEEFIGLADDVGANKGALVASSGFTNTAKIRAKDAGIDVYSLVDAEDHEWQSYIALPFVCDFRGFGGVKFKIAGSNSILKELSGQDPARIPIYDLNFVEIGTTLTLLWAMWNRGEISNEPGIRQVLLKPEPIFAKSKFGPFVHVEILCEFEILKNLYFGEVPLIKFSSFRDEITGKLVLPSESEIITDVIDSRDVERNWLRIESFDTLAVKPIMELLALDYYPSKIPDDAVFPKISSA